MATSMSRSGRRLLSAALAVALGLCLLLMGQFPASAILNGVLDSGRHPYVGIVFNADGFCSGSAVSPTVVVTAAHCVTAGPAEPFRVSFKEGPDGTSVGVYSGRGYRVTDFCDGCGNGLGFASPDVAVVVLDQPVALSRYALLPQPDIVDTLSAQQELTVVGYGANAITTGDGQPQLVVDLRKRMTTARLLSAGAIASDFIKFDSTGRSGVCFGDSGGPDLLGATDTVIAVNSFINGSNCSSTAFSTRLDQPEILAAIRDYVQASPTRTR